MMRACNSFGVSLATEKVKCTCPSTILTFLGITIDTVKLESSLPDPKLLRIFHTVQENRKPSNENQGQRRRREGGSSPCEINYGGLSPL